MAGSTNPAGQEYVKLMELERSMVLVAMQDFRHQK